MQRLAITILAVTLFASPVEVLVLKSGARIAVVGPVTVKDGQAIFRSSSGILYSIAVNQVDIDGTLSAAPPSSGQRIDEPEASALSTARLKVSAEEKARLLSELSKSRGKPALPVKVSPVEPAIKAETVVEVSQRDDEWWWRTEARKLEENVRQRKEDLALLIQKEQDLQDEILSLLSLGYKSQQFSYQVRQLADVRDQIPNARLEIDRAQRAWDQFRDDARRQSILPGWLR